MIATEDVAKELRRIAAEHGGHLQPSDIVEAAKPASSVLHDKFDWDDSVAGHAWRLHQARNLIRVTVEYVGAKDEEVPVRVFVSLVPDRMTHKGYRSMKSVLSNETLRAQLLADALDEMRIFQAKYAGIKELSRVFKAMKAVQKQTAKPSMRSAGD